MGEIKKIVFFLGIVPFLFSCASKPKIKSAASDFCGLIMDENNCPIENFLVCVKQGTKMDCTFTNESGLFYFPEFKAKKIKISGYANSYTKFSEKKFVISENKKMYCWQVKSAQKLLSEVEAYLKLNQWEKAKNQLQDLYFEENSEEKEKCEILLDYLESKMSF